MPRAVTDRIVEINLQCYSPEIAILIGAPHFNVSKSVQVQYSIESTSRIWTWPIFELGRFEGIYVSIRRPKNLQLV